MRDEASNSIPENRVPGHDTPRGRGEFSDAGQPELNDVNILREKTFNPDLRRLVDRVLDHRPAAADAHSGPGSEGRDELLLRLYRLYYSAKNLLDNRDINTAFNPGDVKEASREKGYVRAVEEYLSECLRSHGLSPFAILAYDVDRKGYLPSFENLEHYRSSDIVISLRDGLFRMIMESREGIVLPRESIAGDPLKEKIFSLREGREHRSLYFLLLDHVTSGVAREFSLSGQEAAMPFMPSGILMVELEDRFAVADVHDIFATISRIFPLPLFLVGGVRPLVFSSPDTYDDITDTYYLLDYLFMIFLQMDDGIGCSITFSGDENDRMSYQAKYIIARLSRMLASDSAIIHVVRGRLIILTRRTSQKILEERIGEYRRLLGDKFQLKMFSPSDFRETRDIIHAIVLDR